MATCDCENLTLGNSGIPNCTLIASVTNNLIVVPTFDSTGARNFIDTTVTLDDAFFTDRINAGASGATITDVLQRWYPLPQMKNVVDERAEPISADFGDGTIEIISQGARNFLGQFTGKSASNVFHSKIDGYGCNTISVYIVDINGNLIGSCTEDDKLFPVQIDENTWFVNLMKAVAGTSNQRLQLTYNYDRNEDDTNLRMIKASETTPDVRDLKGLIDVNGEVAASPIVTIDDFTVNLTFDYGSQVTKQPFIGAVLADFDLNEISPTPGAVTIISVTESADGVYDFVITTATSGDVLELDLQKDGFEMDTVTVTIP